MVLSQVLPCSYDKWHFVFSTLFRKLFGIGEIKQDRRKSFLESGLWHILIQKRLGRRRCRPRRALENEFLLVSPLVLKRIRKGYPNGKLAVKDVTFAVEWYNRKRGEALHVYLLDFDNNFVSALNLGTRQRFSAILTGPYPTTKGDAILNGFDIKNNSI